MIKRDKYLNELITSMNNGLPKVVTGMRRSGKSYLLNTIFYQYLIGIGVEQRNILSFEMDDILNYEYRNPIKLINKIKETCIGVTGKKYIFIDEVQMINTIVNPEFSDGKIVTAKMDDENVISFVDVVLGVSRMKDVDLYVTGSNSKFLSSDVITEFRGKSTNIHVLPLSFKEYYTYVGGDTQTALYEYLIHGGMPQSLFENDKEQYLKNLFTTTYIRDILDRNRIRKSESLDEICDVLSYQVGQFLNSQRISNILESRKKEKLSKETVEKFINYFKETYLIQEAKRYDVKGNAVIGSTKKYYFTDLGLRNARLDFTSIDIGQLLENLVYNELIYNGYNVKVGTFNQVEKDKDSKSVMKSYEVDFYATKNAETLYIQICNDIDLQPVKEREMKPFGLIKNAGRKYLVINKPIGLMKMENGILLSGIADFILNQI
ncbi:MAG: ATP-binding protein [Erysipelotrichaceae bacterium]|nr:ATP-binding protein [Erysipelotrichaceae bacterium]